MSALLTGSGTASIFDTPRLSVTPDAVPARDLKNPHHAAAHMADQFAAILPQAADSLNDTAPNAHGTTDSVSRTPDNGALQLGTEAARHLGLVPAAYTLEALTALGKEIVVDHLLSADPLGLPEVLEPPTRRGLARELLRNVGLDPDRVMDVPRLVDPENPLAENTPKSAVDYFFNFDTLSATDLQRMSEQPLAPGKVLAMLKQLPASLNAEFDARFKVYVQAVSTRSAGFLQTRIATYANANGIALENATVSLSRATLRYYTRETEVNYLTSVRYDKTRAEIPADGYLVEITTGQARHRCFLSARTGAIEALPAEGGPYAWLNRHRDAIFDPYAMDAVLSKGAPDWASRVVVSPMGSGRPVEMTQWLSPAFSADVERLRASSRGETPGEALNDTLLNGVIPFREMLMNFRKGDTRGAYYSYLLGLADVIFGIPDVMGVGKGLKSLKGLSQLAGAAYRGTRQAGVSEGIRILRIGIHIPVGTVNGPLPGWQNLHPSGAERIVAQLLAEHPGLAQAVQRAIDSARSVTVRAGWWRVPTDGATASARVSRTGAAPSEAASLIEAAQAIEATAPDGTKLTVLAYGGDGRSYTMYDPIREQRYGPVLSADSAGLLYPSMSVDALERYRVQAADVLQALGSRLPGADGTVTLNDRHYARIGQDYVEVTLDRAVSTANRPAWRALPPPGQVPDIIPHRLVYDKDKGLWCRQTETPQLLGRGRSPDARASSPGGLGTSTSKPPVSAHALRLSPDADQMARFYDVLVSGVQGGATAQQAEAIKTFLRLAESDPAGEVLLRAMTAHHEFTGKAPHIILQGGAAEPPVKRVKFQDAESWHERTEWRLDVDELADVDTQGAVRILKDVYKNLISLPASGRWSFNPGNMWKNYSRVTLRDVRTPAQLEYYHSQFSPVVRAMIEGKVSIDPALEKAWQEWLARTRQPISSRSEALILDLRQQIMQIRYYGGVRERDILAMLRPDSENLIVVQKAPLCFENTYLNEGIPPLPVDTEALEIIVSSSSHTPNFERSLPSLADIPNLRSLKLIHDAAPRDHYGPFKWPALGDSLRELIVVNADTAGLPNPLPAGLRTLEMYGDDLGQPAVRFLKDLPAGLKKLKVANIRITSLPRPLPSELEVLEVINGRLRTVPRLPPGVRIVRVRGNRLNALPEIPSSVTHFDASDNRLIRLPGNVAGLTSATEINIERNPFDPMYVEQVRGTTTARIVFTVSAGSRPVPRSVGLAETIQSMLGRDHFEAITRWHDIERAVVVGSQEANNMAEFARYLNRLRASVSYRDAAFRRELTDLLVELAKPERQALRQAALHLCERVDMVCVDRAAWMIGELRKAKLADDVLLGHYDSRLSDVVDIARQIFRMDRLAPIAREKAKALNMLAEELEVHLAYAVKLRPADELGLTAVAPNMNYFGLVRLTDEDLKKAKDLIRAREIEDFDQYFVTQYEPWQEMLKRKFGERYEHAREQFLDQLSSPDFAREVDEKLSRDGLPRNDPDTRRNVEIAVEKEMRYQAFRSLTVEYLESAYVAYRPKALPSARDGASDHVGVSPS